MFLLLDAHFVEHSFYASDFSCEFERSVYLSLVIYKSTELDFPISCHYADIRALDDRVAEKRGFYLGRNDAVINLVAYTGIFSLDVYFVINLFDAFNLLGNHNGTINLTLAVHKTAQLNFAFTGFDFNIQAFQTGVFKQGGFNFCGDDAVVDFCSY